MGRIRIEGHAGYRGEETPLRPHVEGRLVEITGILSRWTEPDASRLGELECETGDALKSMNGAEDPRGMEAAGKAG